MMRDLGWQREPAGRPEPTQATPASWEVGTMSDEKNRDSKAKESGQGKKERRVFSAEKKYQIFLEAQRGEKPVGEILRREGIYSSDLARIQKQVREGALERLSARSGTKPKKVPAEACEALKRELEEKERALAEQAVDLAVLRKKNNGGSWDR